MNKSSSFSNYYYTITDLTEAQKIALVYCEYYLSLDKLVTYNIDDSSVFRYCIKVSKSNGSFTANLSESGYMDPDAPEDDDHRGYKFNYILVLGSNDVIKAMVMIPDVIDVSDWKTETITIEFDYDVIQKVLPGDYGTLVSVHISDGIRKKVHKDLITSGLVITKSKINSLKPKYKPFINSIDEVNEGDLIHYSGYNLIHEGNVWKRISSDFITLNVNEIPPFVILNNGVRVSKVNGILEFNYSGKLDVVTQDPDFTGFNENSLVSNDYVVDPSRNLYLLNFDLSESKLIATKITLIPESCECMINSFSHDTIFYINRINHSSNFKLFELIDENKSDSYVDPEVKSILYFTDMLYIHEKSNDFKVASYLNQNEISLGLSQLDKVIFLSDTAFIAKSGDDFYLYEDKLNELSKYYLGKTDFLHNIYMVSKSRTNPRIPTNDLISYRGVLHYYSNDKLIPI